MSSPPCPPLEIDPSTLVNPARLATAYYSLRPDPAQPEQRVRFGTSGHRGSSLQCTFNEAHILATTQAICEYRRQNGIDGPLFLGIDTHALSEPAYTTALEVLTANDVSVRIAPDQEYTPTPAISHAILKYNQGRAIGLADGIVITPSHNPPDDGGFKYNPPHGGPAGTDVTTFIENRANVFLQGAQTEVKRMPFASALKAAVRHDFIAEFVGDLPAILDMDVIRASGIRVGVEPFGGAGVHYWNVIAERYGLNLTVVNKAVDATFRFIPPDWDGKIRMDPSSRCAMRGLIALQGKFDIAFACDADHDRHGVVANSTGLLPANDYLAVCIQYLCGERPGWNRDSAIGKSTVSSGFLDRVAKLRGRRVYETPVGFKWFAQGLLDGSVAFAGEESAGSSFLCRDGSAWSTDKDGMIAGLLSAEMTARTGRDPGEAYDGLARELGRPYYARTDVKANVTQRAALGRLAPNQIAASQLAGDKIEAILTTAPGNGQPLGGIKVVAKEGWFAARPSGTEDVYKIYAESFRDPAHLSKIQEEAQAIVLRAVS